MSAQRHIDELHLELTAGDKSSPVWLKLLEHFEAKLRQYRSQLEEPIGMEKTAELRGRIAVLRSLVDLQRGRAPIPTFDDEAYTTTDGWQR